MPAAAGPAKYATFWLVSSREFAPSSCSRGNENQALSDILRTRLLAIHVFASFRGIHRGSRMPIGARGNQHGVDVAAVQQFTEVAIHGTIRVAIFVVSGFFHRLASNFFDIADCYKLNILLFQETAQVIRSAVSDTDPTHNNSLAGSNSTVQAQCRARDNRRRHRRRSTYRYRLLQELTPMKLINLLQHECTPGRWTAGVVFRTL